MPTGVEEFLAVATAAFSMYERGQTTGVPVAATSALLEKFLVSAKKRLIFEPPGSDSGADDPPFLSPVAKAILDIYRQPLPRRSYVLYADASTGKTAAAKHIMRRILGKMPNAPLGIMITGLAPNDDYFSHMAKLLGATGAKGWVHALIRALVPDPRTPDRAHSIIILDEFNSAGPGDINISFVRMLYKALTDRSIYLLIMTQDESVGKKLADLNNRSKITALPGAVDNPEAPMGTVFAWKSMLWDTVLLTKYLERLDNGNNAAIFEEKNEKGELIWLKGPMTPHKARWEYETKIGNAFDEYLEKEILAEYADTV